MLSENSSLSLREYDRKHITDSECHAEVRQIDSSLNAAVQAALSNARIAQVAWAATPVAQRLAVAKRWRHLLAQRAQSVAQTVEYHAHTRVTDTLVAEVLPLADACRFLEHDAAALLAPRYYGARGRPKWLRGVHLEVRREPYGVILIIGPRNYPLYLPGVHGLQALVAGNAVLLKPGTDSSTAALALRDLWQHAGLDPRLFVVLPESPDAVHSACSSPVDIVDKVVLTGSATTGSAILPDLAHALIPAVCELSGCDAVFIQPDADLDLVAAALQFGLSFNGSETCIAPRRVFVPRTLSAELASRLRNLAQAWTYRPLPSSLTPLVLQALAAGAQVLIGHSPHPERYAPLVLSDAAATMSLLQTDMMAPVLALIAVDDDDEALAAAALCPYALGAAVFGRLQTAQALARRVNAGVVVINDIIVPTADPRLPFSGRRRSGFGVTRGAEGLLELTTVKAISTRRGRWRPHYDPPHPADLELFRSYIEGSHGGAWRTRMRGIVGVLRAVAKHLGHRYQNHRG